MEAGLAIAQNRGTPEEFAALAGGLSGPIESDEELRSLWIKVLPIYFHRLSPGLADEFGGRVEYSAAAFNHALAHCLPQFNTLEKLGTIMTPTLVVTGRHDWIPPPAQGAERLHARLPRSEIEVFEQSGHFPFIEEPDRFVKRVTEWILSLERDG